MNVSHKFFFDLVEDGRCENVQKAEMNIIPVEYSHLP